MFFKVNLVCLLRKKDSKMARGSILLFCFIILVGCQKDSQHEGVEIIYRGFQDIEIKTQGDQHPVYIVSDYCGHERENPSILSSGGNIVIGISDNKVTMIGWDTEDLQEGGIVHINDSSKLDGFSVQHGKRWWLKVAEQDSRFSLLNN